MQVTNRALAVCLVILFAATITFAQTQTTGAIQGIVYEAGSKAPVAAAVINVTNEETGLVRTTITNNDGLYFIGMLPPGLYPVGAKHDGYENDPQSTTINFPIRLSKTNLVQPPPIVLRKTGSAPSTVTTSTPASVGTAAVHDSEFERQVNTVNATATISPRISDLPGILSPEAACGWTDSDSWWLRSELRCHARQRRQPVTQCLSDVRPRQH